MFWNSDISFYGGMDSSKSSSGYGDWQEWITSAQNAASSYQSQAPATTEEQAIPFEQASSDPNSYSAYTANDANMLMDPYALNPATFEGFLQKNVAELANVQDLSGVLTEDQRSAYNQWMTSAEAGSAYGAQRYLGRLSQSGDIGNVLKGVKASAQAQSNATGWQKLFDQWVSNVGGSKAAELRGLWEKGVRLDTMRDPQSHGVSKHKRYWEKMSDLMAKAGGFYSWNG